MRPFVRHRAKYSTGIPFTPTMKDMHPKRIFSSYVFWMISEKPPSVEYCRGLIELAEEVIY